ncbi:MAG: pyridoxal phosphate-dependent aminotransferase [Desulfobulbaceae bacterium]|nr:pyridoxal phosphate-dependent aminotransferase [Desulfobulbaceae bacterium]
MSIADNIKSFMGKSSLIREMFEKGTTLKAKYGVDNVYDFSIGNPNLPPPQEFTQQLMQSSGELEPGIHGYMPNAGYPKTKQAVAEFVSRNHHINLTGDEIIMTCGAAGALNVIFRSVLNPGDEVLVPAPYFVEYDFYAANAGGVLKTVATQPDFHLDLDAITESITPRTKVVLINSPNNPTGQLYPAESLAHLGELLREASERHGHVIYLVSDEPYRRIVYDGVQVPSILEYYNESIVVTSFSKDLSIPGERIGYLAVHPAATDKSDLLNAMTLTNRTLGFVNAPALMQRVVPKVLDASVDMTVYTKNRSLLVENLDSYGYKFITPPGTFYLFPQSPIKDDMAFVAALQEERIITVPGSAFGGPGFFRIAFCVSQKTVENALPGFERAIKRF